MDRKHKKKIQSARVIMTNIFMGLSVIAIVFVLMLVAMGFSFKEGGGIEQSGLLQISSRPSGATVEIDGETQFSRTEISKMLSSGQHEIKITKAGYDTWKSNINVDAGLLTNINWVRLFPLEPEIEDVIQIDQTRLLSFSEDRKYLIYAPTDSANLYLISLQNNDIRPEKISIAKILNIDETAAKNAQLSIASWNENGNKLIMRWLNGETINWIIADLKSPEKSINLTTRFGLEISQVLPSNDSASKLWVLERANLRSIDTSGNGTMSGPIVSGVERFANNGDVVAFVSTTVTPATTEMEESYSRSLSIYKEGESAPSVIKDITGAEITNIVLAMGTYWGEEWLAYSLDNNIYIAGGKYPSVEKPTAKNTFKALVTRELSYSPTMITRSTEQRIVIFGNENNITSVDLETKAHYHAQTEDKISAINWLDDYVIWRKVGDKIAIRDFDGSNYRELIKDVNNQLPVNLTANNRWLYYFDVIQEEAEPSSDNADDQQANLLDESKQEIKYILKREKLNI